MLLAPAQADGGERSRFEAAARALTQGDLAAARSGFEAVVAAEPANVAALGNLGVVYARQYEFDRALAAYSRALELAPGNPALELNLGLALYKLHRYADAKPHLQAVLAKQPHHVQARDLLATSLIETGAETEALRLMEQADPDEGVLYLRGLALTRLHREQEARAVFEALFRITSPAMARFLAGRARAESGQYEQAAVDLMEAARLDPSIEGVEREAARALIRLRRFDEAETRLREAITARPADVESRYLLGGVLVQRGAGKEAVAELDSVVRQRPASWGAHYYRGRALLSTGDAHKAVEALEQAARLAPEEASVQFQLARAYQADGRSSDAAAARSRMAELRKAEASEEATLLRAQ